MIYSKDDYSRKFKKGDIVPLDHIYAIQGTLPHGSWEHCDEKGNITKDYHDNNVVFLMDVNIKCVVSYKRQPRNIEDE